MRLASLVLCLACASLDLGVSADPAPDLATYQPHLTVPRIAGPLKIDGDLSKPEWQQAAVIPGLTQNTPQTGQPTEFQSVVYIMRDDSHLYIGMHNVDPDPSQIQIHTLQRRSPGVEHGSAIRRVYFLNDFVKALVIAGNVMVILDSNGHA